MKKCLENEKIAAFDSFGTSVGLNFSIESSDFKSVCGSILTCFVMILTLSFALQSYILLSKRKGTVFTTTLEKEANEGRVFTAEDGL